MLNKIPQRKGSGKLVGGVLSTLVQVTSQSLATGRVISVGLQADLPNTQTVGANLELLQATLDKLDFNSLSSIGPSSKTAAQSDIRSVDIASRQPRLTQVPSQL